MPSEHYIWQPYNSSDSPLPTPVMLCVNFIRCHSERGLGKDINVTTTDNSPDMVKGVLILYDRLQGEQRVYITVRNLFMCGASLMSSIRVSKTAWARTTKENEKILNTINGVKESLKRRYLFDRLKKELNIYLEMQILDCEPRRRLTFEMVRKAFAAQNFWVLSLTVFRRCVSFIFVRLNGRPVTKYADY